MRKYNNYKIYKYYTAYTLIEVLVVVTILSLLFVVGYVSFRDFARRQGVVAAARTLRGDLLLAQESALAGKKPAGCTTLKTYDVNVVSLTLYQVEAVCANATYIIKSTTVASGVGLTVPSLNPLSFKVLGEGTNVPTGNDQTYELTQENTNYKQYVIVNYSGKISGGSLAAVTSSLASPPSPPSPLPYPTFAPIYTTTPTPVATATPTLAPTVPPTPTPTPTPTPASPTADIKCNGQDSCSISYNSSATISWSSTNATSCSVSPSGWTGISGSQSSGNLTSTRTYSLSCSGPGGSATDSVVVNVAPAPTQPPPPPEDWRFVTRREVGCDTDVKFGGWLRARDWKFQMVDGGGGDRTISYHCCGSSGAAVFWGGVGWWYFFPQSDALRVGEWRQISRREPGLNDYLSFHTWVGCNDGERMVVDLYRYAP